MAIGDLGIFGINPNSSIPQFQLGPSPLRFSAAIGYDEKKEEEQKPDQSSLANKN